MGLGHLSRCLALAIVLRERGTRILSFLISPGTAIWADLIRKHQFDCLILDIGDKVGPADHLAPIAGWLKWGQAVDADACRRQLMEIPAWLVVDHYALDKTWEAAIRTVRLETDGHR